jgi:hypothetical protein
MRKLRDNINLDLGQVICEDERRMEVTQHRVQLLFMREREREREKCESRGRVKDTWLRGGRKSVVCEKVPRLRPLVLLVRIKRNCEGVRKKQRLERGGRGA